MRKNVPMLGVNLTHIRPSLRLPTVHIAAETS
jgi:hypothetical protein